MNYIHSWEMGFKQAPSGPCIYKSLSDGLCVLVVYEDDILNAGMFSKKTAQVKATLYRRFRVGKKFLFKKLVKGLNYQKL